ncbi:MAG: hemolysin family protein, partial [Turicibacter sp.]|nr:hemolysin family protein [Turicibacter sp.]
MDPSMYYLILVIMIVLSAFFSASETAFSSVNLIRLRQYAEEGRPGAKKALNVAERFDEVLLAILIGNNIVNLASASLATIVATDVLNLGASGAPIATAVMTILIIIFGEILPKSYAKENAESLSLGIGTIYYYMIIVMKPIIKIFMILKEFVAKLYRKKEDEPSVTEDELNVIIDTMEEEGVLQQDEVEMLQSVLDLSETFVKDIMTPRVDVIAVDIHDSTENIKNVFLEEKYSRIPVYDESRDNIVGILYERDLFSAIIERGSIEDVIVADIMRD